MTESQEPRLQLVTISQAAGYLNCSPQAVRLRAQRGVFRTYHRGRFIMLDLNEIMRFNAQRTNLPSWETLSEQGLLLDTYIPIKEAAAQLGLGLGYLKTLVKRHVLQGCIRVDGTIMVRQKSVHKYLFRGEQNAAVANKVAGL